MCLIDGDDDPEPKRYSQAVKPGDIGYVDMRWFNYMGAGVIHSFEDKPYKGKEKFLFFVRRVTINSHGQFPTKELRDYEEINK